MRSKIRVLIVAFVIVTAITAVVGWLFDAAAGGAALTVLAVAIGVFFGAEWGGESATKTEDYRQDLIGKRKPHTTYYYDDGDDEPEKTKDLP
jgi:hypothetical protein